MKRILTAAIASLTLMLGSTPPAHAIFGVGDIVIDPSNLAQNILTAARTLEMVNNQIIQLQNEAQMLIHQARNLESLDFNAAQRLRMTLATTERLFAEARGLAYEVTRMQEQFERLYPEAYSAATSHDQLNADRRARWVNSREALATAMEMQAQARQNFTEDESVLSDLISQSQSSVGALQASQAGNQLLALQIRQLMQAQQLQVAEGRASALEQARFVAAEERSRELRSRFMTRETRYTPESVQVFR